jgi:hypothetical protein
MDLLLNFALPVGDQTKLRAYSNKFNPLITCFVALQQFAAVLTLSVNS